MNDPRSLPNGAHRREGMVLLNSLLLVMVLFGMAASLLIISLSEARATREATEKTRAFYLAEASLQAAQYEIVDQVDPDGNGIGTVAVTTADGTYKSSVVDLGNGRFEVRGEGHSGERRVRLQTVVNYQQASKFPYAALTLLGTVDKLKINFKKSSGMIVDGNGSPALRISDPDAFTDIYSKFETAYNEELFQNWNMPGITGEEETLSLPIQEQTTYDSDLQDLDAVYRSLVDSTVSMIPQATVMSAPTSSTTWGSAESPGIFYLPSATTLEGHNLTGYGTLIVENQFEIRMNSNFDWNGNVIVMSSDDQKKAQFIAQKGTATVNGNLTVLGESLGDDTNPSSELRVNKDGNVTVNGSLFLGSEYNDTKATATKLQVDSFGQLTVNGLFNMLGRKVDANLGVDSNLAVNGMMQIGTPEEPGAPLDNRKLKLNLGGDFSLTLDEQLVRDGVQALKELDQDLTVPALSSSLLEESVVVEAWQPIYE